MMATMLRQRRTRAFSSEAELVDRTTKWEYDRIVETNWPGIQSVREELQAVWNECRIANWDGFGAIPVSQETFLRADAFLRSLPLGERLPSVGAEPDGQLTLEWHRDARHTLSISVTDDGDLHYAGLFGPNRKYGTVAFFDEAPDDVLRLIEEVGGA